MKTLKQLKEEILLNLKFMDEQKPGSGGDLIYKLYHKDYWRDSWKYDNSLSVKTDYNPL